MYYIEMLFVQLEMTDNDTNIYDNYFDYYF